MKWCNNELIAELTNNEISYDDKYKIFDHLLMRFFLKILFFPSIDHHVEHLGNNFLIGWPSQ